MPGGRLVIIAGRCPELDLALDALAAFDLPVRVIPTIPEAERTLLCAQRPLVAAVLIGLGEHPSEGLALVRALRSLSALDTTPIAVWAPAKAAPLLADAYRAGANSGVLLDGTYEDSVRLAQMVHYWAVANEPPTQEALA